MLALLTNPVISAPSRGALSVTLARSAEELAALQGRTASEIQARFDAGHRAYIAHYFGKAAAFGWVATESAYIGELAAHIFLDSTSRYLWNFVTLPEHRGNGIYPMLLQSILQRESPGANIFWIAYAPENHASAKGIMKAGFVPVAEMSFDREGKPALRATSVEHEAILHGLTSLPVVRDALTPCWRCVRAGRGAMSCDADSCCCDYQRKEQECAA